MRRKLRSLLGVWRGHSGNGGGGNSTSDEKPWSASYRHAHLHGFGLTVLVEEGLVSTAVYIQEIDPTMLRNPVIDAKEREHFVGRGCFGVVKVQLFRGIQVAVKEFLPRSLKADVMHEASILVGLCHPYTFLSCLVSAQRNNPSALSCNFMPLKGYKLLP